MIATRDNYTLGIRKAAIFVASLDQAAADGLLDQLNPERAEAVRNALIEIDQIDESERERIVEEFRRIEAMVPDQWPAGIDLDGPVSWNAPEAVGEEEGAGQGRLATEPPIEADTPTAFGFLREAEDDKLSRLLSRERSQAVAMVLSHLPPERAGNVLARFAPPFQAEVVVRLTELERTDRETLQEVEQALEARLAQWFADERGQAAGPEMVVRILAACNANLAGEILENVAVYDSALAQRLGRRQLNFEDLADFDEGALLGLLRAVGSEIAQTALLGAPPRLVERVLKRMMPREAKLLRRRLENPEPIRLSDIDEARRQIVELAERKLRNKLRPAAAAA